MCRHGEELREVIQMDEVEIEHRLTEAEALSRSNAHRLDDVERRQDNLDELVSTVKVLANREEAVENDVKEIKADVKCLASKPGKKWDNLMDKLFWAVAGGLVTFALSQIGL
jgi:hypothetical protein